MNSWFSKNAELAALCVLGNEIPQDRFLDSLSASHPSQLVERGSRTDVRVQSAPGGGHQVDRYGYVVARICGS
jgi:hypothetical protein